MRDITLCHPRLQILAGRLTEEGARKGLKIAIGESFRTKAEQDALYAQGRTRPGTIVTNAPGNSYSSYHQWGTAFDIYRNDGKGAYYDGDGFFSRAGTIGKSLGLEWGGDWKSFPDRPHFQLPDWGSSTSGIKKLYQNPAEFRKTWGENPAIPVRSGWQKDAGGWRFYLGNTGEPVRNAWYQDQGKWYWFDESGNMVTNTWYRYQDAWYYLGADGAMVRGQLLQDLGKWYYLNEDGVMATEPVTLTPDQNGALKWPGLANERN